MSNQYDTLEEQVKTMARDMERLLRVRKPSAPTKAFLTVRLRPVVEFVRIRCPNCRAVNGAHVMFEGTEVPGESPFPAYTHECIYCGYVITESEWLEVETE